MAEALKNMYNKAFFDSFVKEMQVVYTKFDQKRFIDAIYDSNSNWDELELKERMRHIAVTLEKFLPEKYKVQAEILVALVRHMRAKTDAEMIFEYMFVPDFIEVFGMDDYEASIFAMEEITQFASCEFSIRPFIVKYSQTMDQLMKWTDHKDYRVRRLASEGCRSRLPWAMALPEFKKDPTPVLPILEKLKNDPTDFVYRSVANNLNDISKDNPETTLELCEKWIGKTKNTDWVVRHACRGLLKEGNARALSLFGYSDIHKVYVTEFSLNESSVAIGDDITFRLAIKNISDVRKKLRLEYNVYFMKSNGKQAPKIFKISEVQLDPGKAIGYAKKHSFKLISTRKYYTGAHRIAVVLNGIELDSLDFEVV